MDFKNKLSLIKVTSEAKEYALERLTDIKPDCLIGDWSVGDEVIFTNDYGVEWEQIIIGFHKVDAKHTSDDRLIYTDSEEHGAAYWFPKHDFSLRKKA